jgi:molybdopterin synthase catalytic subunit
MTGGSAVRVSSEIVERPVDVSALLAAVADVRAGATSLFLGTVRDVNDGRAVSGIEYSCYRAMAEREMRAVCDDVAARFGPVAVAVEHRIGMLALGEVSVAIAVSHSRRAGAADGARHAIEELKRRVPIWKREHYVDGTREWIDPTNAGHTAEPGGHEPSTAPVADAMSHAAAGPG